MPDNDATNLLLQTMPDRWPGKTVMGLVASSVAITTTAATYLLGASHQVLGACVLLSGLALGVALFLYFRSYILDEQCFTANLPFELKAEHAQEAANLMEAARKACATELPEGIEVRANIFRPSDEYQEHGCAYVLKIDPRLASRTMSDAEVKHVRFLPGQGHTGMVFVTSRTSYGSASVRVTSEQREYMPSTLVYIMSFPLTWKGRVLGVLYIDFCSKPVDGSPPSDKVKENFAHSVQDKEADLQKIVEEQTPQLAKWLAKGKLRPVRLLRGV